MPYINFNLTSVPKNPFAGVVRRWEMQKFLPVWVLLLTVSGIVILPGLDMAAGLLSFWLAEIIPNLLRLLASTLVTLAISIWA